MTYTKINLYLANGIPEALSNLWYGSDSAFTKFRPAGGGCRWSRLEVVKPTRVHKTTLSLATRASSRQREQFQSLPSATGGKDVDI